MSVIHPRYDCICISTRYKTSIIHLDTMNTDSQAEIIGTNNKPEGVVDIGGGGGIISGIISAGTIPGGEGVSTGIRVDVHHTNKKEHEAGIIARDFVVFCEKQGLDVNDYDVSLKVCVLLSLAGVDVKSLGESLFPNVFLDWKRLSENERVEKKGGKIFENSAVTWIKILQFFTVGVETKENPVPVVLVDYQQLLKQCKMDLELSDVTRLFVLSSVNNQAMLDTVSEYYRIIFPKETIGKRAQHFVGRYVDHRGKFERENYLPGIKWVLQNIRVSEVFRNEVRHHFEHRDSMQSRQVLRAVQLHRGRPCLRDRLASLDVKTNNGAMSTNKQETRDKFRMWCSRVRFPNNVCVWLRQKLYFLRCQRFDTEGEIEGVLRGMVSHDIAKAVCECTIANPDIEVIDTVIARMLFHRKPFPEMIAFRTDAFTGFANSRSLTITNPQVMQLYTSAYQHSSPWQDHWKKIISVMNHTTITHVEKFVHTHPINMQAIIQTLVES